MASNTTFFTPADPISINTLLSLTGESAHLAWILQTATPDTQTDRASGLGSNGDEAAWKAHNARKTVTAVYQCFGITGNLKLPNVGIIASTYHIDTVKLDYNPTGFPSLTVTMHKHTGASTHAADSCNEYASPIVFPAQFGIPATLSDNTTPTPVVMFALTAAGVGMRSLSFGLSCTHVDELGGTGDWLAGDNHDGVETLDLEFTGVPEGADIVIAAVWHTGTDGAPEGNTAVNTRKLSLTRHLARAA